MDVVDDTISDNYITKVPRITKINVAEQKQDSSPEGNLTMEVVDESEMRNLLFENMDFNVTGSDTTCEESSNKPSLNALDDTIPQRNIKINPCVRKICVAERTQNISEVKPTMKSVDHTEMMNPLLEYINSNVIGRDTMFNGPYGSRQVTYCDYTASGKPLRFIEDYIKEYVYSFYANTHTTTSTTSRQTTKFRNEARQIIKECVNASDDDVVVFTGSGTTAAIHKLIHALKLEEDHAKKTAVFVGPFEHHSNILPWKETGAKIVRIKDNSFGTVDMEMLEKELSKYQKRGFVVYVAFSAASNVTGILTDTAAVAEMCHKYDALSFWDYASAGPYCTIDMNSSQTGYKDAVFLSPHKFVGGPGTPGVLIAKKKVFKNPVPGGCGGGTVLYVTRDTHLYLKDIETREEGGTPGIVESIRAGMVFQLKESVGSNLIEEREEELCKKGMRVWKSNTNISILGNTLAKRLPIFSFLVYHHDSGKLLHHNFVSVLLNDLYGIQARGGCACAGPYAMDLLGMSESLAQQFTWFLKDQKEESVEVQCKEPLEIMKPGFARINLPYFMDDEAIHFVLEAVDMVATHGWKLLPQYRFNAHTGAWEHRKFDRYEAPYSLYDIHYAERGMQVVTRGKECTEPLISLEEIARQASKTLKEAFEVNQEIDTSNDEVLSFSNNNEHLVWFLQPREAQIYLATESLKFKPFRRTTLPFKPRSTSAIKRSSRQPIKYTNRNLPTALEEVDGYAKPQEEQPSKNVKKKEKKKKLAQCCVV